MSIWEADPGRDRILDEEIVDEETDLVD